MGSKDSGWHLESQVDAMMVVVMDLMVDSFQELANTRKAVGIPQLILEATVEGFLVTILPGRGHIADRNLYTMLFEIMGAGLRHEFSTLVGVKDARACTGAESLL